MTRPICTEIPHTLIRYNIGQNIGSGLNYVPCEEGVFAERIITRERSLLRVERPVEWIDPQ